MRRRITFTAKDPRDPGRRLRAVARHLTDWQKVAVVSDAEWLKHAIKAFGWVTPGEIRISTSTRVTTPGSS